MDLILMRVMVRGARFIVGNLSATQASCCHVSLVARLGTLEWSVLLGLEASPEVIFLGVKSRQKDNPLLPKFGENSSFFFP
jgi:hypothetical protein